MKQNKSGFTLAEDLITMAIIGVVASLTLPSLMTNTAEQQAKTAYVKLLNTLTEAGQMNATTEGFDYSMVDDAGAYTDDIDDGVQSIGAIIGDKANIDRVQSERAEDLGTNCKNAAVFRDGTAICLGDSATKSNDDGNPYWTVYVDTNGVKGPNKVSKCSDPGCKDKVGRQIYDQFPVTLYKGTAFPGKWQAVETAVNDKEDYAARYAAGYRHEASGTGQGGT